MKMYLIGILALIFLYPVITSAQQGKKATTVTQKLNLARVHLVTSTGTLVSNPENRLDYLRYSLTGEPKLTGKELLDRLPEAQKFARVTSEPKSFPRDTAAELKMLSLSINAYLNDPDIAGVVFTQGTDSIEDTAYFLNLTINSDKPVVVVGAERPFSSLSSDAPLNLLNAIRVAASPASKGKGVLVVANDQINAAREVTKTNTYRVETFQSRDMGLLGYADPDKIVYYRTPTRRHTTQSEFDLTKISSFPRVDILYTYAGGDGELAKAAVAIGAKGLVIAGLGAGGVGNARKVLKELSDKQGIRIVRSSRVGSGRVIRDDSAQEPGFIAADNLNPQKCRRLLQLALTKTTDPDEIQRMFDEY